MADARFHVPLPEISLAPLSHPDEYSREQTCFEAGDAVTVVKDSEGLGWTDLYAVVAEERPHVAVRRAVPALWFAAALREWSLHRRIGDLEYRDSGPAGRVTVTPPGDSVLDVIGAPTLVLHVFLRENVLFEVAGQLFAGPPPEPASLGGFALDDPGLLLLLRAVKHGLYESVQGAGLKMGYLSRALAAHVLQRSPQAPALKPHRRQWKGHGLSSRQLRLVLECIEDNLGHNITINALSTLAGLSRVQFIRRFKVSTRMTPHQYVIETRVRRARQLLIEGLLPLADIAAICGFSSQTHFSSTFKRLVGASPAAYRRMIG